MCRPAAVPHYRPAPLPHPQGPRTGRSTSPSPRSAPHPRPTLTDFPGEGGAYSHLTRGPEPRDGQGPNQRLLKSPNDIKLGKAPVVRLVKGGRLVPIGWPPTPFLLSGGRGVSSLSLPLSHPRLCGPQGGPGAAVPQRVPPGGRRVRPLRHLPDPHGCVPFEPPPQGEEDRVFCGCTDVRRQCFFLGEGDVFFLGVHSQGSGARHRIIWASIKISSSAHVECTERTHAPQCKAARRPTAPGHRSSSPLGCKRLNTP